MDAKTRQPKIKEKMKKMKILTYNQKANFSRTLYSSTSTEKPVKKFLLSFEYYPTKIHLSV